MNARLLASLCLFSTAALAPGLARAGLLEGNHPKVQQGTEAYQKGDWDGALRAYEEAQKELPNSPELQYNLGDVYMKLGRNDDARRSYEAALGKASDKLKPRDYFNLGNALVGLDQKDDAVAAYRQALKLDPNFEPARHNLEVLLRKKNPPQNSPMPGDGGTPPDGGHDGGTDGGRGADGGKSKDSSDGGASDASSGDGGGGGDDAAVDGGRSDGGQGKSDGGQGDGGQKDGGGDGGTQGNGDGGSPDSGGQDGGNMAPSEQQPPEPPKSVDKQEAQRLLDAVRRNEKQFLMHQKKAKTPARPEKDW